MAMTTSFLRLTTAALVIGATGAFAQTSEDITITTADRDIPATVVVPEGEGPFPLVVMNHGHGGGRQENGGFGGIAEALAAKGIMSVRMDFPGTGDSTASFRDGYLSNMVADSDASLAYVIENYAVDTDRLGIFGYSMGGRVALTRVAADDNPYKAVALLAPSADPGEGMMTSFLGGPEAYASLLAEAQSEKGYAVFTTRWGQEQELSLTWFEEMIASKPTELVSGSTLPMMMMFGDKDDVVRPNVGEALQAAVPAIAAHIIEGADHGYGFYSDQPDVTETVETLLADFYTSNL